MNKKLMFFSIILLSFLVLFVSNILRKKYVETFMSYYDDPIQQNTDTIIKPTKEQIEKNSGIIGNTGELLSKRQNQILKHLEKTNLNLNANTIKINNMINDFDVLRHYDTDLNNQTKERTIKSQYRGKKCLDTNLDLPGSVQGHNALKICAQHCNLTDNCISFNYDKVNKKCQLSSLCSLNNTEDNNDFDLYFKKNATINTDISDYTLYPRLKCSQPLTELEHISNNRNDCAKNCTDNPRCISFDYNTNNRKCRLTTDCYNENATTSDNYQLYQKKDIKVHEYINAINIPHNKKNRIILNKFYNDFCIDSQGDSAKLRKCAPKGEKENQTFVYNSKGYLENNKGQCLYYDDSGSGPQTGKHIKLKKCPKDFKKNYKWEFRKNKGGHHHDTLSIVSALKNRSNNEEYYIDANSGMRWLVYNGKVNDIHDNNNSQLILNNYTKVNKNDILKSVWYRDYF